MLICDKRRPARARGYQYQAPPRGPNKDSPPGLRPAPRALLGVGRHAPRPPWAAPPGAPSRTGPLLPRVTQQEGVPGTGAPGGRGGQPLAVVHAGRPAPLLPLDSVFQKAPQGRASGEGSGGACPPRQGGGGQPGPGGGRPGCSRRLCPPSTDWARLSTGDRVQGGAVVQNNLIGQTF